MTVLGGIPNEGFMENKSIHVKGIHVDFKSVQKKRTLFLRIEVDGAHKYISRTFKRNEEVKWAFDQQFKLSSILNVSVVEKRIFLPNKKIVAFVVEAKRLRGKPFVIIEDESLIQAKFECEAAGPFIDVIRNLVEESQKRLASMKLFLEKLYTVCEALNVICSVVEPVTEIHPAISAAVATVTILYEACKRQQEVHQAATNLMTDIASFLPFTDVPVDRIKSRLVENTAYGILVLFEKAARSIIDYSSGSILGDLLGDRMGEIDSYKQEFMRLKETFDWCVKMEIWKTALKIESRTEHLMLSQLHPSLNAFYVQERCCFEGTRGSILQTIADWSASESKLFWLNGTDGTGKTAIAHTVSRSLDKDNRLAACFFWDRNDRDRRLPEKLMPSLAYQLAKWHADYRAIILEILESHNERAIHTGLSSQFELLFKNPFQKLSASASRPPSDQPLIIVLDGLDESCDSPSARRLLADYILQIATLVPWMKVFVTGRRSPEFAGCFNVGPCTQSSLEDPPLDLKTEIALCAARPTIAEQQDENSPTRGSPRTGDASAIDALIQRFVDGIVDKNRYDAAMIPLIVNIFAVASCISENRNLTEKGLEHFLRPFHTEIQSNVFHDIISSFRPLIFTDSESRLQLIFPLSTFLEFMGDRARSGWFHADVDLVSSVIARRCLDTMNLLLRFNICNIESSYVANTAIPDLDSRIRSNIPEHLEYCCLHWINHVLRARDELSLRKVVAELLCSPRSLFWIEVLSLLGAPDIVETTLLRCRVRFEDDGDIMAAGTSLISFISEFKNAIATSTPHIYVSGLSWRSEDPFMSNRIASVFRSRFPIVPGIEESKESQKNVFWVVPDTDRREWNSARFANAVRNSPSGDRIISGRVDGTIQVWDGQTGTPIGNPRKEHSAFVRAVAYSSDGTRIVSGSEDGMLRVWDANTIEPIGRPFEINANDISAVAWSPDGRTVVSSGAALRIWDAQTGTPLCEPQWVITAGKCFNINVVNASPDGQRIATGCQDKTVRIWNARNGQMESVLQGHTSSVNAVAFSPDNSCIVSGSSDGTIIVWNSRTGERIGEPLKGHASAVTSIEYAPDGKSIFSGSPDGMLIIWDAQDGTRREVLRRGEEFWHSESQCYMTIPTWWPQLIAPTSKSIIPSPRLEVGPIELGDDGWIRTSSGDLLLWVPPDHRSRLWHLSQSHVAKGEPCRRVRLDWRNIHRGKSWMKVYRDSHLYVLK